MPFRFAATQRDESLFLKPLKDGPIFRKLKPTLTAALEMVDQTVPNIPVDLPVGTLRVSNREVVLPASYLLVDLANEFRHRLETLLAVG